MACCAHADALAMSATNIIDSVFIKSVSCLYRETEKNDATLNVYRGLVFG
jgi:hypothetical protein